MEVSRQGLKAKRIGVRTRTNEPLGRKEGAAVQPTLRTAIPARRSSNAIANHGPKRGSADGRTTFKVVSTVTEVFTSDTAFSFTVIGPVTENTRFVEVGPSTVPSGNCQK